MLTRNTNICMIHRSRLFYFVRDWKYLGMWRKMNKDFMKNVMIWEKKLLKAGFSSILWELISAWQDSIVEYLVSMISSSSSAPRTNTPSETLHTSKSFTHKGWFLGLEKKLGNACRYFNKDVRITTAMLLRWEKKLKPPTFRSQNVQEPDRGRSFWDSGNCRWDLGGWACWCHSIGSFKFFSFDLIRCQWRVF